MLKVLHKKCQNNLKIVLAVLHIFVKIRITSRQKDTSNLLALFIQRRAIFCSETAPPHFPHDDPLHVFWAGLATKKAVTFYTLR